MTARSKQRQLRKRNQRELARRRIRKSRALGSSPERKLRLDKSELFSDLDRPKLPDHLAHVNEVPDNTGEMEAGPPAESDPDESAHNFWWDRYIAADGPTRLEMTREKLKTVSADDDAYEHLFPEAVHELESKLPREQYITFLEELYEARHDVFSMNADWNTRSMVFEYLAQDRLDDADRVVKALAVELKEVSDPFLNLMSTIRLAGRTEAAQLLIEAAIARLDESRLMNWAVERIMEWAIFPYFQRCNVSGVTDEAIEAVYSVATKWDIEDTDKFQAELRENLLHLSGESNKQWNKAELTTENAEAFRKICVLGFDYQRWLCVERQVEPVVADELRQLVLATIDSMECPFRGFLVGLTRRNFEPYLARKLDFMSLDRIHAPATIVAMRHYYHFLKEVGLVKPGDCHKFQSVCDSLWTKLRRALKDDEWRSYHFLERYFTA